jgi:lipoprotein-releasing system ATP-binding protein
MILKAVNITKSYKSKSGSLLKVLDSIDFELSKGEYVSLIGSSGAGKSTFLNILANLDKSDTGSVKYIFDKKEYDFSKLSDKESSRLRNKKLGFIFQFHHLLPEFTALENIYIPSVIGKIKKKEYKDKATELIEFIGLADRINHKPAELSGGEQQRIAIARSLVNNPEIVFADEPTGNLDSDNSETILQLISNLQKEYQLTFITATHSEIVANNADKVYRISQGKLALQS